MAKVPQPKRGEIIHHMGGSGASIDPNVVRSS